MSVTGTIREVALLPAERRDEMFALMARYYDNMRRDMFEADLDEKQWVIELEDAVSEALCGFSTQIVFDVEVAGRPVRALFSGDTIIDRRYWQRNPLAGLWGRLALRLVSDSPAHDLYWFLISKGYRTYRFLPLFFHEFYPRFDRPLPEREREVLHALGRYKYPAAYDPSAQIVRADPEGCRLRAGVADVFPEQVRDPHVRYFCARNPRHASGDELCCLAPLTADNFTTAAWKMIRATSALETATASGGGDRTS